MTLYTVTPLTDSNLPRASDQLRIPTRRSGFLSICLLSMRDSRSLDVKQLDSLLIAPPPRDVSLRSWLTADTTHLPDIHRHLEHNLSLRQRIPDRFAILVELLPLVFLRRGFA